MNRWRLAFLTTILIIMMAMVGCAPAPGSPAITQSNEKSALPEQTIPEKTGPKLLDTVPISYRLDVPLLFLGGGL